MLHPQGEERLRLFSDSAYPKTVTAVSDTVYHILGFGQSNASFIIGDQSVILIDALDSVETAEDMYSIIREKTDKPVKTLIYTHSHIDHMGGAAAFQDTLETIIAFSPAQQELGRMDMIRPELMRRTGRQFGFHLTDEAAISNGAGPRTGMHGTVKPLQPTKLYNEDAVELEIDGIILQCARAIGETDDQISVWYDAQKVLFCGDNYYGCWPNLYALRGTPFRDLNHWIKTLDRLRAYPAEALLPGHTKPILGKADIQATLRDYRNAIDYVLTATLKGMAEGKRADELAGDIKLPYELAELPFLGEFYGSIDWSVRGIYSGYIGWFDGNPTRLRPLRTSDRAEKIVHLAGDRNAVYDAATEALANDPQWAAELADILLDLNDSDQDARILKAEALEALATLETSANGRHYYLEYAGELRAGQVKK